LNRGLFELRLTSESGKSGTLLKALDSVKVFQAAYMWKLDRLMLEAAHRFGVFISGAFNQAEFPEFTTAIFNSVVDPQCMLYGHLVQECFAHCQSLVNNPKFMTALEYNSKLAVHLYRRLADLQASLGPVNVAKVPHSSSFVDSSAVTSLQSLLDEALDVSSVKQEQVDALEQEVTRLKKTLSEVETADAFKQSHIDALEREPARAEENVPQRKTPVGLEAQVQNLIVQRATKDAVIDNLERQLDVKDKKIDELGHMLIGANQRNTVLTDEINSKRKGQGFLMERNEARETVEKLQARLTVFEDKNRELEARLAAHAQQPITVQAALVPQPSAPAQLPQVAGIRRIEGFGMMAGPVSNMNNTNMSPGPSNVPSHPHSPLPTPPVLTAPTLATQAPRTGGTPTFVEKMMMTRRAAAGIHGGETESTASNEAPASMPLATRGVFTFAQQPARSSSPAASVNGAATASARSPANGVPAGPHAAAARRAIGPHSPQTNGGAHSLSATPGVSNRPHTNGTTQHVPPRVNGSAAIPIVNPAPVAPVAPIAHAAPVARSVAPIAPAAVPAVAVNGHGNGTPDPRDRKIEVQANQIRFLQGQLNDARAGKSLTLFPLFLMLTFPGPASAVQTRGFVGHGPPNPRAAGENARLEKILKALRDYDVDHKSCNDCSINFNAQWRGIVDGTDDRNLVLMCGKCGNEKCRFPC
jgi:hypothetical protein